MPPEPDMPFLPDQPARDPEGVVVAYHGRTKHRFEAYARGPEALDWDAQPAPFRQFAGAPTTALSPLVPGGTESASAPLAARLALPLALDREGLTVAGDLPPAPWNRESLGAWLHLSLGITAWKVMGPDRWAVRANPSSGNLHPVEAYLLVGGEAARAVGLEPGCHHYQPEDHSLALRAAWPAPEGVRLILTTVMWREAWKYGERAFRYCQLDVGHALAGVDIAARALGWPSAPDTAWPWASLAALVGTDRSADFPVRARRRPQNHPETEEAEALVQLFPPGLPPGEPLPAMPPPDTRWYGPASAIDPYPFYDWPVIREVAQATRSPAASLAFSSPQLAPHVPVPLAETGIAFPGRPVGEVILGRRSAQRFQPETVLDRARFLHLLAALLPSTPGEGVGINLLLFVHRVSGFVPGLYYLERVPEPALRAPLSERFPGALDQAVVAVPIPGGSGEGPSRPLYSLAPVEAVPLRRLARSLHCHQDLAANACVALGFLGNLGAGMDQAGAPAYRALLRQAGMLGQRLYLVAEALGLRGTGIGCYFDDPVHDLLGLIPMTSPDIAPGVQSLYHFTVGDPLPDPRVQVEPPYPFPISTY